MEGKWCVVNLGFGAGVGDEGVTKGVPNREAWVRPFPTAQARIWFGKASRLYPAVQTCDMTAQPRPLAWDEKPGEGVS